MVFCQMFSCPILVEKKTSSIMKEKDWSSYPNKQEEIKSFIKTAKLYLKHYP